MDSLIEAARIAQDQNRQRLYSREDKNRVVTKAARQIKQRRDDIKFKSKETKNDPWKGAIPEYTIQTSLPKRRLSYGGYLLVPDDGFAVKTKNLNRYGYEPVRKVFKEYLQDRPFLFQGENNYIVPGYYTIDFTPSFLNSVFRDWAVFANNVSVLPVHGGSGSFPLIKKDNFIVDKHTFEAKIFLPDPSDVQKELKFMNVDDLVTLITNNQQYLSIDIYFDDVGVRITFEYKFNTAGSFNYIAYIRFSRVFFDENNNPSFMYVSEDGFLAAESALYEAKQTFFGLDFRPVGDIGPKLSPGEHDIAICRNKDQLFLFIDGSMVSIFWVDREDTGSVDVFTKRLESQSPITIDENSFENSFKPYPYSITEGLNPSTITEGLNSISGIYSFVLAGSSFTGISVAYSDNFAEDLISSPLDMVGFKNVRHTFGKCLYTSNYTPAEIIDNFA
jgi:hypothetical protein